MRKNIIISISVLALIALVIGTGFAYFVTQFSGGGKIDINATTKTTDSLSFIAASPIRIHATMENFLENMESLKGNTSVTAKLIPNNNTNYAHENYNIFFVIDSNNFEYTSVDKTPELVLKVTDPSGREVTHIEGLKRVENGFDITTRTGGYLIRSDVDISATTQTGTLQNWQVEVTLVNLDSDQNKNKGKTFDGRLYITKEKLSTYEVVKINSIETKTSYNSIDTSLNLVPGTSDIEKYYYAIEEENNPLAYNEVKSKKLANIPSELEFIESSESTYKFQNLKDNTNYHVYSYAVDKEGIKSNIYETTIKTDEYILPSITSVIATNIELYSLTVEAQVENGSSNVKYYKWSSDDGNTWSEETTNNYYTFTNLKDTTEYKIRVKAIDEEKRTSPDYYYSVSTKTYELPKINALNATTTYKSITINITATPGTNGISKYYYKKSTDSNWIETTSSSYTFNNLTDNTTYNFQVKTEDTLNRFSEIKDISATTDTYRTPNITAKVEDITASSYKVIITGTNGDGKITEYRFSKDGGSTWTNWQTSNTYVFDNLTPNTKHFIKTEAKDENNRFSNAYELTATTLKLNFTSNTTDTTGVYDSLPKSLTISIPNVTGYQTYYSETLLTPDNYSTGRQTPITRTNAGVSTIYWCVAKTNYNPYCSSNKITIAKAPSTLNFNTTSLSNSYTTRTAYITYTYQGDGTISCTNGNFSSCSVDTANRKITFTYKGIGTEQISIKISEGVNYLSVTKTVSVGWTCLDPETLIYIWDRKKKKKRKKKIKEIKVGDIVYTFDFKTSGMVTRKVTKVHINKAKEIYHIYLEDDIINTTGDHPIYIDGLGCLNASLVKPGYNLIGLDGQSYEVKKVEVEVLEKEQDMYCLELEDGTNFMVGKYGIVCLGMFVDAFALMIHPEEVEATAALHYDG